MHEENMSLLTTTVIMILLLWYDDMICWWHMFNKLVETTEQIESKRRESILCKEKNDN